MPVSRAERIPDNDFVLTISDDDEDVQGLEDEEESGALAPTPVITSKKRKLEAAVDPNEANTTVKARKGAKSSRTAQNGIPDGDIDPTFEFSPEISGDRVSAGFDGWPLSSNSADTADRTLDGIERIVARRKKSAKAPDSEVESAGVVNQETDKDLVDEVGVESASESDQASHNGKEDASTEQHTARSPDGHQDTDAEEDDLAEPVSHPYDDVEDDDGDEELKRKAAEFFAPEDPAADAVAFARTSASFQSMSLSRPILKGLSAVGFAAPTPIQIKTVPVALLGKDVVGGAVTGSGKTAAFIIPILERLLYRPKKIPATRVGILMPTRELAVQCYNVATKLAAYTDITFALTVGGLSLREQEQTLKRRPDVVIATPGRFIDHMRNSSSFAIENLEILVLDEADRMLEDGFADELNEILRTIPKSRQTMLFSATMTNDVDKLIRVGLNRPVRLMVDAKHQTVQQLTQEFIKLKGGRDEFEEHWRLAYLLQLCTETYTSKTIIFFPRKALAHRVKILFALRNIKAAELHGSMTQEQRLNSIASFREGTSTHLLATDLASRGLDIPHVETVINFTVPSSTTIYLHRVGRTARAGQAGVACTLFSAAKPTQSKSSSGSERSLLRPILRLGRNQSAIIQTRTIPKVDVKDSADVVLSLQTEIDAILVEEKEERLLQQSERDVIKGENLVKYAAEIASRPKRTWFKSQDDKQTDSKELKSANQNSDKHNGRNSITKEKRKLSGKDKKKLQDRDDRLEGNSVGRKKGKAARIGKMTGKPAASKFKKKAKKR